MTAFPDREILFPEGQSWGALYALEDGPGYDEPWWVSMPSKVLVPGLAPVERFLNWERIGDARGRNTVEMNSLVGYRSALELPGGPGELETVGEELFHAIDLSYSSLDDEQLSGILSKAAIARSLDLSFTFVSGDQVEELGGLQELQILHLAFTKMGNSSLVQLASLGDLVVLNLMGAGIARPDTTHLPALSALTSLECLDLGFNPVSDQDLEIVAGLEGLRILGLVNTDITDEGVETIKGMKNLRRLYLGRNLITDEGVKVLSGMKGLRSLSISGPGITDRSVVHLAEMEDLQKLYLRGTAITEKSARAITANIPDCEVDYGSGKGIRSDDHTGTRITDMGEG